MFQGNNNRSIFLHPAKILHLALDKIHKLIFALYYMLEKR